MDTSKLNERVTEVSRKEEASVQRFLDAAKKHSAARRPGNLVVYIEDDLAQVSLIKTVFAVYCSLRVIPVDTIQSAKELIQRKANQLKCVIMDVTLSEEPVKDVLDAVKMIYWIKSLMGAEFPVMLMSSNAELANAVHARVELPLDIHIKGEPMETLVERVQEFYRKEGDGVCADTVNHAADG